MHLMINLAGIFRKALNRMHLMINLAGIFRSVTVNCHFCSVPANLSAPFEDILIPLLLQHSLILLVLTLSIVVLVVALLLRPL